MLRAHDVRLYLADGSFATPAQLRGAACEDIPHADAVVGAGERLVVPTRVDASDRRPDDRRPRPAGRNGDGRLVSRRPADSEWTRPDGSRRRQARGRARVPLRPALRALPTPGSVERGRRHPARRRRHGHVAGLLHGRHAQRRHHGRGQLRGRLRLARDCGPDRRTSRHGQRAGAASVGSFTGPRRCATSSRPPPRPACRTWGPPPSPAATKTIRRWVERDAEGDQSVLRHVRLADAGRGHVRGLQPHNPDRRVTAAPDRHRAGTGAAGSDTGDPAAGRGR